MLAPFGRRSSKAASIGLALGAGLAAYGAFWIEAQAQGLAIQAPAYTADGRLEFPKAYREWIYLSSGMDMSYSDAAARGTSLFDNVFVNPEAYRAFQTTGTWPDKTVLVLELRKADQHGSMLKSGHFQSDRLRSEVHIKDSARFAGGWAFFAFDGETPATVIPQTATCYSCHQANGAVDTTFVQFYPTLLPLARAKQTISPTYRETP